VKLQNGVPDFCTTGGSPKGARSEISSSHRLHDDLDHEEVDNEEEQQQHQISSNTKEFEENEEELSEQQLIGSIDRIGRIDF